jgi:hypothetical protein
MALMMVPARLSHPALIQHLAAYYREVGCMTFHPTQPAAWLSLRIKQRKEYPREELITLLQITVVIAFGKCSRSAGLVWSGRRGWTLKTFYLGPSHGSINYPKFHGAYKPTSQVKPSRSLPPFEFLFLGFTELIAVF